MRRAANTNKIERHYTAAQAAEILSMDVRSVRRAILRGAISAVKYGQWRIPRSSLERFWALKCNALGTLPRLDAG